MRITLDNDLADLLREQARLTGASPDETANRALRAGLAEGRRTPKTAPHSFGFRPEIDLNKLGQLTDELETLSCASGAGQLANCIAATRA